MHLLVPLKMPALCYVVSYAWGWYLCKGCHRKININCNFYNLNMVSIVCCILVFLLFYLGFASF